MEGLAFHDPFHISPIHFGIKCIISRNLGVASPKEAFWAHYKYRGDKFPQIMNYEL
jgi:hypothetical protein